MSNKVNLMYNSVKGLIVRNRRLVVVMIFLLQAAISNYLAFILRFEFNLQPVYLRQFLFYLPFLLLIRLVIYLLFGLYKNLWRYSSVDDLLKIIKSVTLGSLMFFLAVSYLFGETHYPRSLYIFDWLLLIMISGGSRLLIRVFREYAQADPLGKKVLIVGAGDAGEMLVRDMMHNPSYNYDPIGFIDDDPYKKGLSLHGLPIFGARDIIGEVIKRHRPDEIVLSLPSTSYKINRELYDTCKPFNISIKTLPGLSSILDGTVSVSMIKPLSLEDLLQRDCIKTDLVVIKSYIKDKAVLVTGAGGSIGSELCRQILDYGPSSLILFDRYENSLFEIDSELKETVRRKTTNKPQVTSQQLLLVSIVGDMRDREALENLFSTYRPQFVFHAAAHKHVPLMESNPLEAVKNNIFGTKNLMETAARHKAESFVMVSTDKAVNPTNIMGATKRVAEYLALTMNRSSSTRFTTVRFGNVLGSNGSVVPTFRKQLSLGGPLTVTHPDIKRFFMLIPEAVQLVLIAAASGEGGEIFVLDMGEQIKIVDLAENLIRLSGFVPHEDIRIEFTGLRPGEKLYEELFDESEKVSTTAHEKLRKALPDKIPSRQELTLHLSELERILADNATEELVPELQKLVPNFKKGHFA